MKKFRITQSAIDDSFEVIEFLDNDTFNIGGFSGNTIEQAVNIFLEGKVSSKLFSSDDIEYILYEEENIIVLEFDCIYEFINNNPERFI